MAIAIIRGAKAIPGPTRWATRLINTWQGSKKMGGWDRNTHNLDRVVLMQGGHGIATSSGIPPLEYGVPSVYQGGGLLPLGALEGFIKITREKHG